MCVRYACVTYGNHGPLDVPAELALDDVLDVLLAQLLVLLKRRAQLRETPAEIRAVVTRQKTRRKPRDRKLRVQLRKEQNGKFNRAAQGLDLWFFSSRVAIPLRPPWLAPQLNL